MCDDDDDYMSSSFLNVTEDIRPGLSNSKSVKRKHEIEKKQIASNKMHRTKSRKEMEEEYRKVGMNSALNAENKGFALLQKMGYKPGMKLGRQKDTPTDSGLLEPIKVKVKTDRGGLGREEQIRKRIEEREEHRHKMKVYKEKETEALTEEFRQRMRNTRLEKRLYRDLSKSQKVCEQLDSNTNVEDPLRPWFWFSEQTDGEDEDFEEEEEEEAQDQISVEEKIEFITDYIRHKYFYCFWCGVKYEGEDDLSNNCPGPDRDSHEDLSS